MEPLYVLIKVDVRGQVQVFQTVSPDVPDHLILPGETAFVVHATDIKSRHDHEPFRKYQEKDTQ
jgi:hypothetical protein